MSGYKGYKESDNSRRKANNTQDNHYDSSTNTNTKAWTTMGSNMNNDQQKRNEKRINKNAKVKIYTDAEKKALAKKMGLTVKKETK